MEGKLQKLWPRLKFFLLTSLTRPFVPSLLLAVNSDELSSLSKLGCDDSAASRACTFENLQSEITIILILHIYHTKFHLWNKRPKGPHIMHLSTMCHLFEESAKVDICWLISPKNTNLVEDFEILLPDKFCWNPFSGFKKVENVSANQRSGRPSCFSDRPEKHKLGRGHWDLASCQVSLNSVQWCQRRSWKCEKLTTDGRTDGRLTMRDHNSALEPSAQVHSKLSL